MKICKGEIIASTKKKIKIGGYEKRTRTLVSVLTFISTLFFSTGTAFAGIENIGSSISSWVITNGFLLGLAVVVVICIPLIVKKSWMVLVVALLVAGIILAIMSNPRVLKSVGTGILNILGI